MTLALNLGDIVIDTEMSNKVMVVARKDEDGQPFILPGYESDPQVTGVLPFVTNLSGRVVIILEKYPTARHLQSVGDAYYTWTNDSSLQSTTVGTELVVSPVFPPKKSFVATWFVKGRNELFTVSLHYNEQEDQLYSYDSASDIFLPECDHGYSQDFFAKVGATFFVAKEMHD